MLREGLFKRVSSMNSIIDSSVVLGKALLKMRVAGEEEFLGWSGAHVA